MYCDGYKDRLRTTRIALVPTGVCCMRQRYFKRRDFSLQSGNCSSIMFPVISTDTRRIGSLLFSNILCAVFIIEPLHGKAYFLGF